jgi:Flp pilus assembly protein TadD
LGETAEARRLLDELLREQGTSKKFAADVLWERAQVAEAEGDLERAEGWFREAARRAPHDRKAHHALYLCLLRRGKRREAEGPLAREKEIDANLKRIERLTQAVMRSPDDADLRCQVGLLFLHNGQEAEGVRWLAQAVRLDPNCRQARQALAEQARKGGKRGP